jgi:hypothetical protein
MEMVKREDIMMSMPHPRTKNNAGYPDGFKDKEYFKDAHFQGIGFRWGMGLDLSERRLCEYRCLALEDDLLNWYADDPTRPSISWRSPKFRDKHLAMGSTRAHRSTI